MHAYGMEYLEDSRIGETLDFSFLLSSSESSDSLCERTQCDHALELLKSLQSLREAGTACDFVVLVENETFPVHRSVLAACSDYFKAMFEHDMREATEGVVDMKEVERDAVEKCISFMYSGVIDVDFTNVQNIMHVASLMQLNSLMKHCFSYMRKHLTPNNCLLVLSLAKLYSYNEEIENTEQFAKRSLSSLMMSEDFLQLGFPDMIKLFKDSPEDQNVIWTAGLSWIKFDSKSRSKHMIDLLRSISLTTFSVQFLLLSVIDEDLVKNSNACKELVSCEIYKNFQSVSCNINTDNCYKWKEFVNLKTQNTNADELRLFVDDFMMNHFEEIMYDERFLDLTMEDITHFLHSSVHPVLLWQSILKWLKHDVSRHHLLKEMLEIKKFDGMTSSSIVELFHSQVLAKEDFDSEIMLLEMICSKLSISENKEEYSEAGACYLPSSSSSSHTMTNSIALLGAYSSNIRWMNLRTSQWKDCGLFAFYTMRLAKIASLDGSLYLLSDDRLYIFTDNCSWEQLKTHPDRRDKRTHLVAFQSKLYTLISEDMRYYSPATDEWSEPISVANISNEYCVTSSESHIYIIGGHFLQNRCVRYSPHDSRWSYIASMNERRHNAAAACLNGRIYVLGGFYSSKALSTAECYNPTTNSWSTISRMGYCRRRFSACVANGIIYAVGGAFTDDGLQREEEDTIEAYLPTQNRWITTGRMDQVCLPISACCFNDEIENDDLFLL